MNLVDLLKRPVLKRVEKPWGYELFIANDEKNNYCGKILHINKDKCFSLHLHDIKRESFMCILGEIEIALLDMSNYTLHKGILCPGDCIDIDRLLPHQLRGIEESEIIEISTFHRDEDSYRIRREWV